MLPIVTPIEHPPGAAAPTGGAASLARLVPTSILLTRFLGGCFILGPVLGLLLRPVLALGW